MVDNMLRASVVRAVPLVATILASQDGEPLSQEGARMAEIEFNEADWQAEALPLEHGLVLFTNVSITLPLALSVWVKLIRACLTLPSGQRVFTSDCHVESGVPPMAGCG